MKKKQLKNIILDIELLPEGVYLATSKDVPGLVVEAKTIEEIKEVAEDFTPYLLKKTQERQKAVNDYIVPSPIGRMLYPMAVMV